MKKLFLLFALLPLCLGALPKLNYNLNTSATLPDAEVAALGGWQLTYAGHWSSFTNPAMLNMVKESTLSSSFTVVPEQSDSGFLSKPFASGNIWRFQSAGFTTDDHFSAHWRQLANLKQRVTADDGLSRFYQNYDLSLVQLSLGEKQENLYWGANIKYIYGSLVYLSETQQDGLWVTDELTDTDAHGVSADLGLLYKSGNFSFGATLYDPFSRIWWKDQPHQKLKSAIGWGADISNEESKIMLAWRQGLAWKADKSLHAGYEQLVARQWSILNNVYLRTGVFSESLTESEDTAGTWGLSFTYSWIKVDTAMIVPQFSIDKSTYMVNLSIAAGSGD